MSLTFTVNGVQREIEAAPEMPLLWVLRDLLGLTGTRYGCGSGLCGACTVHLDGAAIQACTTTLAAVQNRHVTTIEGLAAAGDHPLQRAWIAEHVSQCGYCQAGQIMAAAALLAQTPEPSTAEINTALAGNLCRCGAYLRIRRAILHAAQGGTE